MKKFFVLIFLFALGILSLFASQTDFAFAQSSTTSQTQNVYVVTANFAYIYKESNFSSEKLLLLPSDNLTL